MTTAAMGFGQNIKHHLAGLALFTVHGMMKRRIPEFTPPSKPCRGLFSGVIRYQSSTPTKTDTSFDIVASYETQTSGLYFATSRETDDDHSWEYALSGDYQFENVHFLAGFGRRGHDNSATLLAFGFGGSYDVTDQHLLGRGHRSTP